MIKILIVDDSIIARKTLSRVIEKNSNMQIVALAINGEEAVAFAAQYDPDVITMDVEMPKMNGLEAVSRIMAQTPCPILMVSSLTAEGAESTFKALEFGALDFILKTRLDDSATITQFSEQLVQKIAQLAPRKAGLRLFHKRVANRMLATPASTPPRLAPALASPTPVRQVVTSRMASASAVASSALHAAPVNTTFAHSLAFDALFIGVSTGGPPVVQRLLSSLPENFPLPILIAQHMPANFTGLFAKRVDAVSAIKVKEASHLDPLVPGTAYICPGGRHLRAERKGNSLFAVLGDEPKEAPYKPSVNVLMESAALSCGRRALALMLTGMGNDGLEGSKILKAKGGTLMAQSEASCVVYGMPRVVIEAKLVDKVVDSTDIAVTLINLLK